jgi:hypothetical protein
MNKKPLFDSNQSI